MVVIKLKVLPVAGRASKEEAGTVLDSAGLAQVTRSLMLGNDFTHLGDAQSLKSMLNWPPAGKVSMPITTPN